MKKKPNKLEKIVGFFIMRCLTLIRPSWSTKAAIYLYRHWGMKIEGIPNYISSSCWFDGSDYSRISLGNGCTISSNVSFLTHDWSLHTVGRSLGVEKTPPYGRQGNITVGDYTFIGRESILMPNSSIGRGSIVGAGSVIRGNIPEYSIVIGNPCRIIGNSKEYFYSKVNENE